MKKYYYLFSAFGQRFSWLIVKPLYHFFLRLEIKGKENIQDIKGPVIFAMNHISELDPFFLPISFNIFSAQLPIIFVSLERKNYDKRRYLPTFFYNSFFFRFLGAYPVTLGLKNYEKSLETHIDFLKHGVSVAIFLEGRRSPDAGIQKAKGGIIELVKQTGCPVVPVSLSGHHDTTYRDFFGRKRRSLLIFGKPITQDEILNGYDDVTHSYYSLIATERIMMQIARLMDEHMRHRIMREIREQR